MSCAGTERLVYYPHDFHLFCACWQAYFSCDNYISSFFQGLLFKKIKVLASVKNKTPAVVYWTGCQHVFSSKEDLFMWTPRYLHKDTWVILWLLMTTGSWWVTLVILLPWHVEMSENWKWKRHCSITTNYKAVTAVAMFLLHIFVLKLDNNNKKSLPWNCQKQAKHLLLLTVLDDDEAINTAPKTCQI